MCVDTKLMLTQAKVCKNADAIDYCEFVVVLGVFRSAEGSACLRLSSGCHRLSTVPHILYQA